MRALRQYLALFRERGYRWFWLGSTIDMLGSQVSLIALVWLVKESTHSAEAVGALYSAGQAPLAIGCFLLGPLLDRFSRRRLMVMDNLVRGLLMGALALLALGGDLQVWLVLVILGLSAFLSATTTIGASAITPALLEDGGLLQTANALNQTRWQVAYMVGPAVGGLLLALFRPESVLLGDAVTFLLFALALAALPTRVDQRLERPSSYWASLKEGARFLVGSRPLREVTLHTFLFNLAYGPFLVALPFLIDLRLGGGAAALGLLQSALAAGSLVGGFLVPFLPEGRTRETIVVITMLWGLFTLPLLWITSLPLAMGAIFLAGASFAPYNVLVITARQRAIPPEAYGRVIGLTMLVTQLGAPVGAWFGGPLVTGLGAPAAIAVAALFSVALGALSWFSPGLAGLDRLGEREEEVPRTGLSV